jgi:putative SOS response-associated peptidase YedK
MCGRFVLKTPPDTLKRHFGFVELPNLRPRYNIAPTDEVPVIRQRREPAGERSLQLLRWGLVAPWEKDLSGGARCINARSETLLEKPTFKKPFQRRRCLVPADGFYEWRKEGKLRVPHLIQRADGGLFAFAGLWDRWWPAKDDRERYVDTFTIVTTAANARLQPLHDRMPVILDPADYASWLDPDADPEELRRRLLKPAPDDLLAISEVDPRVNSVKNDDADLIRAVQKLA